MATSDWLIFHVTSRRSVMMAKTDEKLLECLDISSVCVMEAMLTCGT